MKNLLLLGALALSINAFGQVPNYVPSNGLVGWWGFNGNANDESGNGNNGTVNGASLIIDRFDAETFSKSDVLTSNNSLIEFRISGKS